jgi:hypothetical protein
MVDNLSIGKVSADGKPGVENQLDPDLEIPTFLRRQAD